MKNILPKLKKVALFYDISDEDILSLLQCLEAKKVQYLANQVIFSQGEMVELVGIVLSGNIQIIKDDFYGNRNIVSNVGECELFAEAFVCANVEKMPVSVISTVKSEILLINYKKLTTVCKSTCGFHSKMVFNMLKILASKNVNITQKIDILSKRTTKDKILSYLYGEFQKNGRKIFEIPLNRQQMADFLFVDRSALSNELAKLKKDGVIDFNKNKFEIFNEE
ncbi:MAG: Crp/Fnr family transcriptional regulator [Clostridia bacterium]